MLQLLLLMLLEINIGSAVAEFVGAATAVASENNIESVVAEFVGAATAVLMLLKIIMDRCFPFRSP